MKDATSSGPGPQDFRRLFAQNGLKLTHQRLEIYSELVSAHDHPCAETVWKRVRERVPTISLDTVYRTLTTLREHGLAVRVPVDGDTARFDGNVTPHHHLACECCGRIDDLPLNEFDPGRFQKTVAHWGRVRDAQVVIRGICRRCLESGGRDGSNSNNSEGA
ncbi:MAG: Fur family transcriptional regulator [Thermodesulfobacteriota bacterium]